MTRRRFHWPLRIAAACIALGVLGTIPIVFSAVRALNDIALKGGATPAVVASGVDVVPLLWLAPLLLAGGLLFADWRRSGSRTSDPP